MKLELKTIVTALALYILQVGALWGLLEGYTYFQGEDLKTIFGSYWIMIYIIPIFSTIYVLYNKTREKTSAHEAVVTQGNYSPGEVGGHYAIQQRSEHEEQTSSIEDEQEESQQNTSKIEPQKSIKTKGNYSPGIVKGNYKVER